MHLSRLDDRRLAARVGAGDEAAFAELYDRHHAALLSFCRHMVGSREDGEDALQQTFLRAHRALAAGHVPDSVRAWLFAIARNRCLTLIAARRSAAVPVEEIEVSFDGLSDEVRARADLRELLADLEQLPEDQRAALVLSELGDLSHVEIAGAIGCQPGKVKALVFQARTSLIADRDARDTPCDDIRAELAVASGGALRRGPLKRHLRQCDPCRAFQVARRPAARRACLDPPGRAVGGPAGRGARQRGSGRGIERRRRAGRSRRGRGGVAMGGGGAVAGAGLGAAGIVAAGGVAFKSVVAKAAVTAVAAAGGAVGIHHAAPVTPTLPPLRTASATVTPDPAPVSGASGEAEVPVPGDGSALPPEAAPPRGRRLDGRGDVGEHRRVRRAGHDRGAPPPAGAGSGARSSAAGWACRRRRRRSSAARARRRSCPDDTPPPRRPRVRRQATPPAATRDADRERDADTDSASTAAPAAAAACHPGAAHPDRDTRALERRRRPVRARARGRGGPRRRRPRRPRPRRRRRRRRPKRRRSRPRRRPRSRGGAIAPPAP